MRSPTIWDFGFGVICNPCHPMHQCRKKVKFDTFVICNWLSPSELRCIARITFQLSGFCYALGFHAHQKPHHRCGCPVGSCCKYVRNISWDLLNILSRAHSAQDGYSTSPGKYSTYSTRYFQYLSWGDNGFHATFSIVGGHWQWAIKSTLPFTFFQQKGNAHCNQIKFIVTVQFCHLLKKGVETDHENIIPGFCTKAEGVSYWIYTMLQEHCQQGWNIFFPIKQQQWNKSGKYPTTKDTVKGWCILQIPSCNMSCGQKRKELHFQVGVADWTRLARETWNLKPIHRYPKYSETRSTEYHWLPVAVLIPYSLNSMTI